jgi:hypothetical protein
MLASAALAVLLWLSLAAQVSGVQSFNTGVILCSSRHSSGGSRWQRDPNMLNQRKQLTKVMLRFEKSSLVGSVSIGTAAVRCKQLQCSQRPDHLAAIL